MAAIGNALAIVTSGRRRLTVNSPSTTGEAHDLSRTKDSAVEKMVRRSRIGCMIFAAGREEVVVPVGNRDV